MSTLVWVLGVLAGCIDKEGGGGDPLLGETAASVTELGVVTCAEAPSTTRYRRAESRVPQPFDPWIWHGGITAADLNDDGLLDVLLATEEGVLLQEGAVGGTFIERFDTFGVFDLTFASGTSTADYDGDGDLDVYVMRVAGDPSPEWSEAEPYGKNRLLRNEGGLVFTDVTDQAGVGACGPHHRTGEMGCWKSMSSSWGDGDGDGDLDLYVGNYGFVDETEGTQQEDMEPAEPDYLYLNEGDGTFADVSDRLPPEFHDGYT